MLKKSIYTSLVLSVLIAPMFTACNNDSKTEKTTNTKVEKLSTMEEKAGYSIGTQVGKQLISTKGMVDRDALLKGINDALDEKELKLTLEEMQKVMQEFGVKMQAKANADMKVSLEANAKEGSEFLTANKAKEGVVTLASGLQYKIITAGTGKIPKATDKVETNYKGTLINGTEFDSSYKRGQTVSFPVNGVIKGWTEALQLMKEGSKWELYIPSELAYGAKGAGQAIGPNATLIFEIELIKII